MESVRFYKYTATGNDFVLFDEKEIGEFDLSSDEIIRICDRHFGIGADGVLVISGSDENDFGLRFFNPDGTSGMLCANGSRCAVHYALKAGYFNGSNAVFSANGEKYSAYVESENIVSLKLNDLEISVKALSVETDGVSANGYFVDTGAPHFVIDVSETGCRSLNDVDVKLLGAKFCKAEFFQPEETNVDFIEVADGSVKMRTFERGVENETLSCGTGAIAAGLIAGSVYGLAAPIKIEMPGGTAVVDFNSSEDFVSLTGKIQLIYEGKIYLDRG